MINNLIIPNIRIFVFGTLRVGGRLDYYMEGSSPLGLVYTRGQLMESPKGSAYIDFDDTQAFTIGELHQINYYCLQRINHLEITWGEFPKGYELQLIPVWPYSNEIAPDFKTGQQSMALCYRMKEAKKVHGGDWKKLKNVITETGDFLGSEKERTIYANDLIEHLTNYLLPDTEIITPINRE